MGEIEEIKKRRKKELMKELKKMKINPGSFQKDVIEHSKKQPVITDFWADWCRPCKMLEPILEEVVENYDVRLAKVNVDDHPEISNKYKIRSIPLVGFFKDGELKDQFVGVRSKEMVKQWMEKNLK